MNQRFAKVSFPWVEYNVHYLIDQRQRYVDVQAELLYNGTKGNYVVSCAYNEEAVEISSVRAGKLNPSDGKYSWDTIKEIKNQFGLERSFHTKIPNKEAQIPFITCTPAIEKALGEVEWKLPANVNFAWTDDGFKLEVQGKVDGKDVMVVCDSVEETQTVTTRALDGGK